MRSTPRLARSRSAPVPSPLGSECALQTGGGETPEAAPPAPPPLPRYQLPPPPPPEPPPTDELLLELKLLLELELELLLELLDGSMSDADASLTMRGANAA